MTELKDFLTEVSEVAPSKGKPKKPLSQEELRDQMISRFEVDSSPSLTVPPKPKKQEEGLTPKEFLDEIEREAEDSIRRFRKKIKDDARYKDEKGAEAKEEEEDTSHDHDECMQYLEDRVLAGDECSKVLRLYNDGMRRGKMLTPKQLKKARAIVRDEPLHKFYEKVKVYRQIPRIKAELKVLVDDDDTPVRTHNEASNGLGLIANYEKDKRLMGKQFSYLLRTLRKLNVKVD